MKTEKQLPQAIECEESLLAYCLLGGAREVAELLGPEDFYRIGHQKIFKAICEMVKQGLTVDLSALAIALKDSGEQEGAPTPINRKIPFGNCMFQKDIRSLTSPVFTWIDQVLSLRPAPVSL